MIKEIYILHRDSGLPLNHTHIIPIEDDPDSTLFSGALQGIRSFLQESKIGDLTSFTTQENRIEVRCDIGIVVAVVADINDSKENIDIITEDIAALFVSLFEKEIESFNGELAPFKTFDETLKDLIKLEFGESIVSENSIIISTASEAKNIKFSDESNSYLNLLTDWVKNRFDPTANIKTNVFIFCPPDKALLKVDILLEGGSRRMNKLDEWIAKHLIAYGGTRNVVFVIELGPAHGPAQIRQDLEKIIKIGNPKYSKNPEIYQFYPVEVLFFGPNVEKSSFQGLNDMIKTYKSEHIVVTEYVNHIAREHSPHHSFLRCKVSGWKWNLKPISVNNIPTQVFP